jgi:hypothetical protein
MKWRTDYIVPLAYLLIVGICLYQASAFAFLDAGGFDWFAACMILTLPWSIFTYVFMIAMHMGSDNGVITAIGFTALINAGLLYLLFRPRQKKNTN